MTLTEAQKLFNNKRHIHEHYDNEGLDKFTLAIAIDGLKNESGDKIDLPVNVDGVYYVDLTQSELDQIKSIMPGFVDVFDAMTYCVDSHVIAYGRYSAHTNNGVEIAYDYFTPNYYIKGVFKDMKEYLKNESIALINDWFNTDFKDKTEFVTALNQIEEIILNREDETGRIEI